MLNNKSILVTGGTGSFGENFINLILKKINYLSKQCTFRSEVNYEHPTIYFFNL